VVNIASLSSGGHLYYVGSGYAGILGFIDASGKFPGNFI
jgi:N-acetylmuramic acid 6-phosphate (MurNAc-6-P) etherase